jgi:hypothetical protein
MATTKLELAQRALKVLYPELRGDEKTSLKEMVYAIGNSRDFIIKRNVWERYSLDEDIFWDGYIKQYDAYVYKDVNRGMWYATLPATPLDLPHNKGVYMITACNDTSDVYIPTKKTHNWLYGGSFAQDMEGGNMYFQEGNKIYLSNSFNENAQINITLVPAGNDIDEDDEDFGVSPDIEIDVINKAVELYSIQKNIPQDFTNNRLSDI